MKVTVNSVVYRAVKKKYSTTNTHLAFVRSCWANGLSCNGIVNLCTMIQRSTLTNKTGKANARQVRYIAGNLSNV